MIDTPILCCDRTHELATTGGECPCVSCRSHRCIQALHADAATLRAENDRLRRRLGDLADELEERVPRSPNDESKATNMYIAAKLRAVLEGETG